MNKSIPKKKKSKKAKWLSEEALQIAEEREVKSKGERERHTQLNSVFQRISRRDGKNTQKNCIKKILMNWITTMVWLVTQSQTFWSVKSSRP